jgi:GNAT superfamily N-acetyltransferase
MSEYNFVRLNSENFSDLIALMAVVNGSSPDVPRMKKKYDTERFGAQNVGYLAYKNGDTTAAAYYGVFPMRLLVEGKQVLAAQSGDTMTHPDHRGKGLFIELAKRTYALAKDEGIAFVFGFPNANSYPGFVKKLAWKHPYSTVAINIFAVTAPINLLAKKSAFVSRLQERWLSAMLSLFFKKVQSCPIRGSSVLAAGASGVVRDQVFWDYKEGSGAFFQSGKTVMFLKYDGDVCIGDIVSDGSDGDLASAVRKLRWASALAGVARIKTYCSPDSKLAAMLAGHGHSRESSAYGYVAFGEGSGDLDKLQFTYVDYDTF